ncbi:MULTISPECIES: DUF4124 domain-containing protein [Acidovorax]|uniref:DUF4124 domain-containing protein n=1 Tax=Acidovorax facilis TaxID=12917 RepID=A0ABV8DC33_9BURK|nr:MULTISPECIES: DUF4124 domain-containing protein [Acidovorax]KQB56673.1 hypothetical protein AE621_24880 [Acidovorax sp. SD340]MBO1011070.1 DUF4124 domain-containing protein [Acidovorax sp. SD340]MCO4245410.1 DUF4124 domain-containing protein [Acidovorax facilis]
MKVEQVFRLAACAALSGIATLSIADERIIYKSTLSDGRIIYSDEPVPKASRKEKISIERHPPNAQDAEAAQKALSMSRAQLLENAAARSARLKQLDKQVDDAYSELKSAESALQQGQEVQEGERQGRRLTPSYFQRRQALANAVQKARRRLDGLLNERASLQY